MMRGVGSVILLLIVGSTLGCAGSQPSSEAPSVAGLYTSCASPYGACWRGVFRPDSTFSVRTYHVQSDPSSLPTLGRGPVCGRWHHTAEGSLRLEVQTEPEIRETETGPCPDSLRIALRGGCPQGPLRNLNLRHRGRWISADAEGQLVLAKEQNEEVRLSPLVYEPFSLNPGAVEACALEVSLPFTATWQEWIGTRWRVRGRALYPLNTPKWPSHWPLRRVGPAAE